MSEQLIELMRSKRDVASVLRLRFLKFRGNCSAAPIFAFEGVDDRTVWSRWIFRVAPFMVFEPFICEGKREARKLSNLLETDRGGMGDVKIFVDRDFDDLDGFGALDRVFATDRYSFENYFIERDLLDLCLRDDLGCNGLPDLRETVLNKFFSDLKSYCDLSSPFNRRLFVSARCGISRQERLAKITNEIATIEIDKISSAGNLPSEVIKLRQEPSLQAFHSLEPDFSKLDPIRRYRGKDLLGFLMKWFSKLQEAIRGGDQRFPAVESVEQPRFHHLTIHALASRSPIPNGLQAFLI